MAALQVSARQTLGKGEYRSKASSQRESPTRPLRHNMRAQDSGPAYLRPAPAEGDVDTLRTSVRQQLV